MTDDFYAGREQSLVKHLILKQYLKRFAQIIGQNWRSITYVDCFAGPWQAKSQDLQDTSFGIAVSELRAAREALLRNFGRSVKIRGFFLEEDRAAFNELDTYAQQQTDMEVVARNLRLEDAVEEIVSFVRRDRDTFPFILIDPKGWSGFDIEIIRPLLELRPGEVLVNFMIEHIRRFVEANDTGIKNSFTRLFGSDVRDQIAGLPSEQRDDAISRVYLNTLQSVGGFDFGSMAVVLHPDLDRRFFYLSYVTRDLKGIEVFKDAEKRSMREMEKLRARAIQRQRIHKTKQRELFAPDDCHDSTYFEDLRISYLTRARDLVYEELITKKRILFDDVWKHAVKWPMVWDSDVKIWIADWIQDGTLQRIEGLSPKERVPKLKSKHFLCSNETMQ